MKRLILLLVALAAVCSESFSQCSPNVQYQNADLGFYPLTTTNCSFTFVSQTDTLSPIELVPGNPTDITYYLDAYRINEIIDLPFGLTASTDVINTADGAGPYGYWYNSGSVPNQTNVLGCLVIEEGATSFASLSSGGPNNDGIYPMTIETDVRIAGTSPDLSSIVSNGSWWSSMPASLGGGTFTYEVMMDVNTCITCAPTSSSSSATTCASYFWNGQTYTQTGSFSYVTVNSQGCDSTATLNLTILPFYNTTENHALCGGESVTVGTVTYNSPGQFSQQFTALNGCDSVLTINVSVESEPTVSILGNVNIIENTAETYAIVEQPGYNITWEAVNGDIISGQGTPAATIFWDATGGGVVIATLSNGNCTYVYTLSVGNAMGILDGQNQQIVVGPNPSNGLFKIDLPNLKKQVSIVVYSATGKTVFFANEMGSFDIDLSNQSPGLYTLHLYTERGVVTRKLVLN
jgi:hypothetical protein